MGRKKLNHVQYKRNIHPDFVSTMDKTLNDLRIEKSESKKHVESEKHKTIN